MRPTDGLIVPAILGRSGSIARSSEGDRAQFLRQLRPIGELRTPFGRVKDRLIAHAFSVGGEGLEGVYARESLREIAEWMLRFINAARHGSEAHQGQVAKILPLMAQAMQWSDASTRLGKEQFAMASSAQIVECLARDGRALWPLSVSDRNEGHLFLVDLQRREAGDYAVRIINTGDGIEHHPSKFRAQKFKMVYQRCIERIGVSQEQLLGHVIPAITAPSLRGAEPSVSAKISQFYASFATMGLASDKAGPFAASQRVGNCGWKSAMAFLKENLEAAAYREFKLYIRSRLLDEAVRQVTMESVQEGRGRGLRRARGSIPGRLSKAQLLRRADQRVYQEVHRHTAGAPSYSEAIRTLSGQRSRWIRVAASRSESLPYFVTSYVDHDRTRTNDEAARRLAGSDAAVGEAG